MYTASPCFTVPLPGGRPAPSGPMLMSQDARSSGEIGLPRLGLCWANTEDASVRRSAGAAATKILRIDIFHLAGAVGADADVPGGEVFGRDRLAEVRTLLGKHGGRKREKKRWCGGNENPTHRHFLSRH